MHRNDRQDRIGCRLSSPCHDPRRAPSAFQLPRDPALVKVAGIATRTGSCSAGRTAAGVSGSFWRRGPGRAGGQAKATGRGLMRQDTTAATKDFRCCTGVPEAGH